MGTDKRRPAAWMWLLLVASAVSFSSMTATAQSRRYTVGATVYTNPNFSGESATFRDDTPDLRAYGLNDKISSIELPPGETWEVCQDVDYANRCQVLSGSISDLRSIGWNDRISSLRRLGFQGPRSGGVFSPNPAPELVIYDRPGFRGASRRVTSQTSNFGNRAGSVEVLGGTWELCDRYGHCATVSQNVSDLSQLGLSGQITLARPLNNRRDGRGYGRDRRYYGR